jgi:hypothetical protein
MLRKGGLASVEASLSPSRPTTRAVPSSSSALPGYGVEHGDGKRSKMKKKKESNLMKMAVAVVFGVALLVLLVMAKFNSIPHNGMHHRGNKAAIKNAGTKDGPALLRRAVQQLDDAKDNGKDDGDVGGDDAGGNPSDDPEDGAEPENGVERGIAVGSLPPNSVYRLTVEDIYGDMVDLSKYIGMVTLIVNVACM